MAKIQLIDDDAEIAANLSLILKKEGYDVNVLDSTENAIPHLVQNQPDLLILDVMFPENPAGGFDLARLIRQTEAIKNLPVILLTSINQEFPMDFTSGDIDPDWMPVQDFAEKPVSVPDILEKVNRLIPKT